VGLGGRTGNTDASAAVGMGAGGVYPGGGVISWAKENSQPDKSIRHRKQTGMIRIRFIEIIIDSLLLFHNVDRTDRQL